MRARRSNTPEPHHKERATRTNTSPRKTVPSIYCNHPLNSSEHASRDNLLSLIDASCCSFHSCLAN